jgi:7-cyano-7-deazaguanine synthase
MSRRKGSPEVPAAVVLLSGGLDSATALYMAKRRGFSCICLFFDYGQRHLREWQAAKKIAHSARSPLLPIRISLPWGGSSLLNRRAGLPARRGKNARIPSTYVPARNIIFLSYALSCAEALRARAIFIGAHTQDYSDYPDCRMPFLRAFRRVIGAGTKAGVEGKGIRIEAPLIGMNKAQIIAKGIRLGVPLARTWSCYRGGAKPCGTCDSCYFRAKGFREAGIDDPAGAAYR